MKFVSLFTIVALASSTYASVAPKDVDPAKFYTLTSAASADTALDSCSGNACTNKVGNAADVGKDNGMRFRFPDGIPGKVVSAAHNDHILGADFGINALGGGGTSVRTDSKADTKAPVTAHPSDDGIYLQVTEEEFVGDAGEAVGSQFKWVLTETTAPVQRRSSAKFYGRRTYEMN